MKPLADRVIVKIVEREEKTQSGIFLPDTAKEKSSEGVVVAVGSGRVLDNGTKVPVEVSVGDKVMFAKYAGTEIKIDGLDHMILNERDILAIVD